MKPQCLSEMIGDIYNAGYEDGERLGDYKSSKLIEMEHIRKRLILLLPEPRYVLGETDKYTTDYCEGFNRCLTLVLNKISSQRPGKEELLK